MLNEPGFITSRIVGFGSLNLNPKPGYREGLASVFLSSERKAFEAVQGNIGAWLVSGGHSFGWTQVIAATVHLCRPQRPYLGHTTT